MVEKAASIALDHKLIIRGRSVSRWDEDLHQLVKDLQACFDRDWIKVVLGVIL